MTELTTREAAERLGVNQSRVRALVASGALTARRAGSQWLVEPDSLDHQKELTQANATGRGMAQHVAWAAADVADGGGAAWLSASDRSRLRRRLHAAASIDVLRRWLSSRASTVVRYRVGERDLDRLLSADGVIRTGVSVADSYHLGFGTGGTGDAYVTANVADHLVRGFFLIESRNGNLTLRVVEDNLHLLASRRVDAQRVCPRLIVGVDLADDRETRTRAGGRELLRTVLDEQRGH
jgi:excisionase family DNA binding protein